MQIINSKSLKIMSTKDIHFWIVLLTVFFLIYLYLYWPWRSFNIEDSLWKYIPLISSLEYVSVLEVRYRIFGIFFLIPIIYIILFFNWQSVLYFLSLATVGLTPIILGFAIGLSSLWLSYTFLLLLPCTLGGIVSLEKELRRRERAFWTQQEVERKIYISRIYEAQENERKRIAQEIHDEILQTLIAVIHCVENINISAISTKERNVDRIRNYLLKVVNDLRQMSLNLRPRLLDELGLVSALQWLINNLNLEGDIHYKLIVHGIERKLPPETELLIYRIVQEALNNVKKHSKAERAITSVVFTKKNIEIVIEDNGIGFPVSVTRNQLAVNGKMGLLDMQERVTSLGGKLNIQSEANEGTIVSFTVNV